MVGMKDDFYESYRDYENRRIIDKSPTLNSEEIRNVCKYLENPTKTGIWYLKGKWRFDTGISEYVHSELIKEFEGKDEIDIQSGRREIKIILNEEDKREIFDRLNRMTLIFNIFTYLYYLENKPLRSSYLYHIDEKICDIIDTQKLKLKYNDAYEYFKKEIFFEGFDTIIYLDNITKIKDGFFILTDLSDETGNLSIASMDKSNLEKLNIFLTKVGKTTDCKIFPIFSPEESVFAPYFSLLGMVYPYFIEEENIKKLFEKSIKEYRDGNYSYCVSTIGLIAEDYLTRIYETIYRDVCPKKLTLGQIFDLIHNKLKQNVPVQTKPIPEIDPLYNRIDELLNKELTEGEEDDISKEILELIRKILYFIQTDKKYNKYLFEKQQKKKEYNISIFPDFLKDNIKELIGFRNATSHNSRIPIFNYEALRTVYCCITLVIWWINEQNKIEWEDNQETILKKSIERNSTPN